MTTPEEQSWFASLKNFGANLGRPLAVLAHETITDLAMISSGFWGSVDRFWAGCQALVRKWQLDWSLRWRSFRELLVWDAPALLKEARYDLFIICCELLDWWSQARFFRSLGALPCLLLLPCAICAISWALAVPARNIIEHCTEAAELGRAAGNERLELFCYERLVRLDGAHSIHWYRLAMAYDRLGKDRQCRQIMERLAPDDQFGYVPAHLWRDRQLLEAPTIGRQQATQVWRNLQRILTHEPHNAEAHLLLAKLLLNLGRTKEAEPHLAAAASLGPELQLLLARLYADKGDKREAVATAGQLREALVEQLRAQPDDPHLLVNLAYATALLDDPADAIDLLERRFIQQPAAPLKVALANLCVAAWDAQTPADRTDQSNQLALLEKALRYDPANHAALLRLLKQKNTPAAPNRIRAELAIANFADRQDLPGRQHLLLGNDYWQTGQPLEARAHFEAARRAEPNLTDATNNLAWMLAHTEPIDLDRALELINEALEKAPAHPSLLDTRGQILAKIGHWQQAVDDLELVAFLRPENKSLHLTLADCYDQLGMATASASHRKLAANPPRPTAQPGPAIQVIDVDPPLKP